MIRLRKIFFYFVPWMGRKFWTKVTNGTGSVVAAGRTVIKIVLFIPATILSGLTQLNKFYIHALRTEPVVLKFLVALLVAAVTCMVGLCLMFAVAGFSGGKILPQPGNVLTYIFYLLAVYNVYALLAVAYQEFEKEQRHMLNNLSDENLNDN